MKLPWDKKYLKISFHVIFTLAVFYVLMLIINGLFYGLTNLPEMFSNVSSGAGKILSVLSPLVIALISAYLLDPIVDFFQKHFEKIIATRPKGRLFHKRTAGTLLTYLSVILILILSGYFLVSRFAWQNGGDSLIGPNFMEELSVRIAVTFDGLKEAYDRLQINLAYLGLSEYTNSFFSYVTDFIQNAGKSAVNVVASIGSSLFSFLLSFVIAFYLLKDKEAIMHKAGEVMDTFLPEKINRTLKNILGDIDAIFSGYIRGQLTDALIMSVLIGSWLSIVRVDFAVVIGIFSGLSNLIPYFGAFIGFAASVLVALLNGEPMRALYAGIGIIVLQQIDGMYIAPRVVGESVELSPLLVILSLSVAGPLFGITGMILAVPVCATIKLFLARFMKRKKNV